MVDSTVQLAESSTKWTPSRCPRDCNLQGREHTRLRPGHLWQRDTSPAGLRSQCKVGLCCYSALPCGARPRHCPPKRARLLRQPGRADMTAEQHQCAPVWRRLQEGDCPLQACRRHPHTQAGRQQCSRGSISRVVSSCGWQAAQVQRGDVAMSCSHA